MLGGARSLYAIVQWGREHPQFARTLGFSRERTPCVATLHHMFRRMDVDAFETALGRWAKNAWRRGQGLLISHFCKLKRSEGLKCRCRAMVPCVRGCPPP